MSRLFILIAMCFVVSGLRAQWKWSDPLQADFRVVQNQGWNEDGGNYRRLPLRAKQAVRREVWNLACESAGLSLCFVTDASEIRVRYLVTGGRSMPHMPATGVSGVDLYKVGVDGKEQICYGNYSFGDTIQFSYKVDKNRCDGDRSEGEVCQLAESAVRQIREKSLAPILLVEHAGYSNGETNEKQFRTYSLPNAGLKRAYRSLKQAGVKKVYYLSREELDYDPDAWVDDVHPSDLGMMRQAKAISKKIFRKF